MDSPSPGDICRQLADELDQHWSASEDLNKSHREIIATLRSVGDEDSIRAFIPTLAGHLEGILQGGQPEQFKTAVLRTFADATREVPFWRSLFGVEAKPDHATNMRQFCKRKSPDSILEVARRVIAGTTKISFPEQMRYALRIIANTCANDNNNRSIIINRDGIEQLLELLRNRCECDLVIPVLYNVCVDYDEPATDVHGNPWPPPPRMQVVGAEASSEPTLSAAEQRLGTYWFLYEDKTSFEIILKAKEHAENCAGTVADLVDMASRVALYGTENFVQENDGRDPDERGEVNTTDDIVHSLLKEGADLASVDIDCCRSICQAVLNVLSQEDTHSTVINSEGALRHLIYLPYLPGDDEEDDDEEGLAPYRKEILKLVYKISATEAYAQTITVDSPLIRNCVDLLHPTSDVPSQPSVPAPLASSCVLLANCITTTERARGLLCSTQIGAVLPGLLARTADPEVLLPAIDLAARLALCPEGQVAFSGAKDCMLPVITQLLHDRSGEVDAIGLEIQRNAVALARLLIKGRSLEISNLSMSSVLVGRDFSPLTTTLAEEIYGLSDRTKDIQTKVELGRLFIEILRTVFSVSAPANAPGSVGVSDSVPDQMTRETAELNFLGTFGSLKSTSTASSTPTFRDAVTDMICFIITQSHPQSQPHTPTPSPVQPNAQAEAEAWFGLGLLSTAPSARPSIRTALARNDNHLLSQLRDIVSKGSSTPEKDETKTTASTEHEPTKAVAKDPRYENIKVLVVNMLQVQSPSHQDGAHDPNYSIRGEEALVQAGLEAAAAEMGLDWVIV